MTSTFLSYRIYAANSAKSLQRVAAEPQNAVDQKYFEANIGKVKSVDQFIGNYRLFTYAMKAYGLDDLGNAKALMRQVLTSDLTDANSVANRLNDSRYKAIAKAFNFSTSGTIASSAPLQTNAQQQDMLSRLSLSTNGAASLTSSLAKVTSVDGFEKNTGLYAQVLNAYGIDPTAVTKSDVAQALESNLSDPQSFANRPDFGGSTTYAKLKTMAEDFNFAADGSVGGQRMLQSISNMTSTQTAYMSQIKTDAASQAIGKEESAYYLAQMPMMTSVSQIVSNPRLVSYLKTAFGLDSAMTSDQMKSVLTSNLLDPSSAANTFGVNPTKTATTAPSNYQLFAAAFNVGTDGNAWDHTQVASAANLAAVTTAYKATVNTQDKDAVTAAQTEVDYFTKTVPSMKSVTSLLADSRIVAYLRTAFNLPAPVAATNKLAATPGTTVADLKDILTSNVLDPNSAANTKGDAVRKLATTFNFAPNGSVHNQKPLQNASNLTAATTAYAAQAGKGAKAQAETDYYQSTMPYVKSVDDLLGDKRLIAYLDTAYNIPTSTSKLTLRQVLTSNLSDPKSKANQLGGNYQTLAAAFDIGSDGKVASTPAKQVQSKAGAAATHNTYLNQAMESEAGDADGDGTRLALYFKRVAPTITSAYGILADKAMTKIVQTMLGLSTTSSKADIDSQARYIASKVKISDFQNPAKLEKMVSRFAALYDLSNTSSDGSGGSSNPTLSLFSS